MAIRKGPKHHNQLDAIPHGEISMEDNASATVIAGAGTAVQVTTFDTNGVSDTDTTPDHTQDHILIGITGTYAVEVTAAVDSVGAGAIIMQLQVQTNNGGTEIIPHVNRDLAGGAGEMGSVTMGGLAALTVGDTVELWIENETSTTNLLVESASLSVLQVA